MNRWPIFVVLSIGLAACNSSISSTVPVAPSSGAVTPTGRALVVGAASGVVYNKLTTSYRVSPGSGAEDPSAYDLVVFDGNSMAPQAIAANAAAGNFLRAGKAVLLLNNTEAHRSIGFSGVLGGHINGSSPATIFFEQRGKNGLPASEVDIEFPQHIVAGIRGNTALSRPASALELSNDAQAFIAAFQRRFGKLGGSNTGPAPVFGLGTTNYSIDVVQTLNINMPSAYTEITAPADFEWCDDVTSFGVPGACTPNTNPTTTDNAISADFETVLNVLLEPSGPQTYLHKVLARQYAYISPSPWPDSSWETSVLYADAVNGVNNPNGSETTMLGFNAAVLLIGSPSWSGANGNPSMVVTETEPTATNNTSQLTTSQSQTEQVGVSVGGGYTGGGNGVLGANWSDSWTWAAADTINITDWASSSSTIPGDSAAVQYQFAASGNTQDTYANLLQAGIGGSPNPGYTAPQFTGLLLGPQNLNALQQSGMVSQDETVWKSSGGVVAPAPQVFQAYADFQIGEVYQFFSAQLTQYNYGNIGAALISEPITIDFSKPSLQPPALAPWTLSFGQYTSPKPGYKQITGTVSLPRVAGTATTIFLSYVIQPQVAMLTRPINQVCPGNTTSFIPGNSVINNGQPPLSITIPPGKKSASFSLTFEVFNSSTYNVQSVAWLPQTTLSGANLFNAQSAVCLTPPNA